MGLFSCLLVKRPSDWLTDRVKLLILMRFFLLILSVVQKHNKKDWCNFYNDMCSFVNLANEYLSKYDDLTGTQKKAYQKRLNVILEKLSHNQAYFIGGTWVQSWTLRQLFAFYRAVKREVERKPFPGEISYAINLPQFSYTPLRDRQSNQEIERELYGVLFDLPRDMRKAFPVIFQSDSHSQPLNVPPPIVSKPFVKANQPSNKSSGILWYLNSMTGNLEPYPAKLAEQIPVA